MAEPQPELVSVVVPCYNGERWLAAALDSALAQTWPAIEVVVVDDGSTDDSVEVARAVAQRAERPVTVLTGPNQGPAAARNRGIAAAAGAHVQLLDADDLLLPRKVELCLAARTGPDDVPFSRLLPFGGPPGGASGRLGRWLRAPPVPFDPTRPVVSALTHEVQTSQSVYPIERLRRIGGFRPSLRWLEDIDLNLRLTLDGARYVSVDAPLVLLRDHAAPGRQRLHAGAAAGRLEGERAMMDAVRDAGQWSPEVARVFADRLAYAGRQAWIAGHEELGRSALDEALALDPRARPTGIPLYNAVAARLGVERTERWLRALRR